MPVLRETARFTGAVLVIDPTQNEHDAEAFLHAYESIPFGDDLEVRGVRRLAGWGGTLKGDLPWRDLAEESVTLRLGNGSEALAVISDRHDHLHAEIRGSGSRPF
jgi:hypothetical protein